MKLYVWDSPTNISYGGSILYVLAPNLREARKQALNAVDAGYGMIGGSTRSFADLGEPTRVLDKPAAEYYWWAE